tara:strand:- start:89 stop:307 length:219 start_codon:yes stop_codon:yes gene_type:complete
MIQSFPIIPNAYNDNIIDQLDINYIFIERNESDKNIIQRYLDNENFNLVIIDSFKIANKYDVDLFRIDDVSF